MKLTGITTTFTSFVSTAAVAMQPVPTTTALSASTTTAATSTTTAMLHVSTTTAATSTAMLTLSATSTMNTASAVFASDPLVFGLDCTTYTCSTGYACIDGVCQCVAPLRYNPLLATCVSGKTNKNLVNSLIIMEHNTEPAYFNKYGTISSFYPWF